MDILLCMDNYVNLNRRLVNLKPYNLVKKHKLNKEADVIIEALLDCSIYDLLDALYIYVTNTTKAVAYYSNDIYCDFSVESDSGCKVDVEIKDGHVHMKFYDATYSKHADDYAEFSYMMDSRTFRSAISYYGRAFTFEDSNEEEPVAPKSIKDIWNILKNFYSKDIVLEVLLTLT